MDLDLSFNLVQRQEQALDLQQRLLLALDEWVAAYTTPITDRDGVTRLRDARRALMEVAREVQEARPE